MKLIGSLIEGQFRNDLASSNAALQGQESERLRRALLSVGFPPERAYVLDWIPDQAEDIYRVLVSDDCVLTVELPRRGGNPLLRRQALRDYLRKCSKIQRIKVAVALDMLSSK
jgi:hypothetical protein